MFTAAYGMSGAAAAKVGNALGGGHPNRAKKIAQCAVAMTLCIALLNTSLLYLFHHQLFSAFTSDEAVLAKTDSLFLLAGVVHVCDCLQFVFQGIFTACGKNYWGFPILMVSLIGVGISTALVLSFHFRYGAWGLFFGLGLGLFSAIPIFVVVVVFKFDWARLASEAGALSMKKTKKGASAPRSGEPLEEDPRSMFAEDELSA